MKALAFLASALVTASSMPADAAIIQTYFLQGTAGIGLLPGNEPGSITGGTGGEFGAGIFLDDGNDANPATNLLTISNVGWGSSQNFSDLTSTATASHIHGPTGANNGLGFTQTTGVLFTLTRSSSLATGGTFTNVPINLTAAQVGELNNGRYYINLHTSNNPGGEIRGFIVPVPEPSAMALGAAGLVGLLGRRHRKA